MNDAYYYLDNCRKRYLEHLGKEDRKYAIENMGEVRPEQFDWNRDKTTNLAFLKEAWKWIRESEKIYGRYHSIIFETYFLKGKVLLSLKKI